MYGAPSMNVVCLSMITLRRAHKLRTTYITVGLRVYYIRRFVSAGRLPSSPYGYGHTEQPSPEGNWWLDHLHIRNCGIKLACVIIGDPIFDRIAVYCNDLMWREPRTTSATFLGSISAKFTTCPDGGSRHMVSHSRKVSIKGLNLPKNPFFRITYLWSGYG